jgi:hypothetical protein
VQSFSIKTPFCFVRFYLLVEDRLVEIQRERTITHDKAPIKDDIYQWFDTPLLKHMNVTIEQKGYVWEDESKEKSLIYSFILSVPNHMPTIKIYNRQKRLMCVLPHMQGMTTNDVCDFLDIINIFLPGNPFVNFVWDGPKELPSHLVADINSLFHTVMVREC